MNAIAIADSNARRLLVVDDEELVRWSLSEYFRGEGFDVEEATNGADAIERFEKLRPDVMLLDLVMPEMGGMDCLRELRRRGHQVPVIILTALGDVAPAVEATQLGASRYLTKPFELVDVKDAVDQALESAQVHEIELGEPGVDRYGELLGGSPSMKKVFGLLRQLEDIDTPTVLITGESGTGKDLVARAIHSKGERSGGPFVEVDCTAIPEQLLESTLFGHERGAFTDAKQQKRGLFEVARGGVVFLDEIGELPLPLQAKLLRVLENRKFRRVGGNVDLAFDAAVVTATNRNLQEEVREGRFREDLYYRLAVVTIDLPPLRARGDDIRVLMNYFIESYNQSFHRDVEAVSAPALKQLQTYPWPGNIRELRNVVERMVIFNKGDTIELNHLPAEIRYATDAAGNDGCPFILPETGIALADVEKSLVRQALDRTEGNQTEAARLLDISRFALRNRMKKFGLLSD